MERGHLTSVKCKQFFYLRSRDVDSCNYNHVIQLIHVLKLQRGYLVANVKKFSFLKISRRKITVLKVMVVTDFKKVFLRRMRLKFQIK